MSHETVTSAGAWGPGCADMIYVGADCVSCSAKLIVSLPPVNQCPAGALYLVRSKTLLQDHFKEATGAKGLLENFTFLVSNTLIILLSVKRGQQILEHDEVGVFKGGERGSSVTKHMVHHMVQSHSFHSAYASGCCSQEERI